MKTSKHLDFTFIIPTYNAQKYLKRCLESIESQRYDKKSYEVFIIDGGSTDDTLRIINSFKKTLPITVFKNVKRDAESGKFIGIKNSKADVIILLDSDNVIVYKDWLSRAKYILDSHPGIWGVESPWLVDSKDTLINQYFAMLKMTDPVARLFRPVKEKLENYGYYDIVTVKANDTPVTGANGFFWRKQLVEDKINPAEKFEETNYVSFLVSKGNVTFARMKYNGIYHYYCHSISSFIQKRKKIANKFLSRKAQRQKTWVDRVGYQKLLISMLYNISIVGPTVEAVYQLIKTRNAGWINHPIACFSTVVIYTYYFVTRRVHSKNILKLPNKT